MSLVRLPVPLADPLAARVLPWLRAACARPGCDLTAADLVRLCAVGEAQMIGIAVDGALAAVGVSQVRDDAAGRRSCWILAVGGAQAKAWRHTLRAIEAGAAALGCATVEFVGRSGWRRLLPDYRATPCAVGVHYSKILGDA
ncbi:hypothetical protein [Methylobacterium organophilum]|uniref:GNAT family N-acetyltransferase n=1 Tax=Methylobacterium organophilum TaxID=410 RepID=A0ABQ4TGC2_METOR|nr:hypothetical protein [Methylobacterium organophilum]GJE29809.1 hypothetical protein LKMONMHP_4695 [Methylobacterium organophilum]